MSNNCLVTKLKGTISNDNLPILNTAFIDYFGKTVSANTTLVFIIESGEEPVKIKFNRTFHMGNPSGPTVSGWITLAANTKQSYSVTTDEIGVESISKIIEIKNIYKLKRLACETTPFFFNLDASHGLNSVIDYDNNLEVFGGRFELTQLPQNMVDIPYILLNTTNRSNPFNIDNLGDCKVIYNYIINSTGETGNQSTLLTEFTALNSKLEASNLRFKNDIVNLPINTKVMLANNSDLTGSIESYVTRVRGLGRTSGSMALQSARFGNTVTFNGTSIVTQFANNTLPYNTTYDCAYLTWTASTIEFTAAKPAELNDIYPIPTPYYWNPD